MKGIDFNAEDLIKSCQSIAPPFEAFNSIPRLSRDIVITEKLDGTNAQILITEDNRIYAGSRNRWLTRGADNYGFFDWVDKNACELFKLGPGRHYGEFWGAGIQRGYGLTEKRFSLFNVHRWMGRDYRDGTGSQLPLPGTMPAKMEFCPSCCSVVPILYRGPFDMNMVTASLEGLRYAGSAAAPGYLRPEGIVIYHTAGKCLFKKTLDGDGPKSKHEAGTIQQEVP